MQVIDISQGNGMQAGLKSIADALTPDGDKEMRAAYLQQQAQKTSAETARINAQRDAQAASAAMLAKNDMSAILANPELRHQWESFGFAGQDPDKLDAKNFGEFSTGAYFRAPPVNPQPMGGGPQVPQALMSPGGIAPPRMGSSAGSGPIASAAEQYRDKVTAVARANGVDPELAMRVLSVESGGNPNAVSSRQAKGLFQLVDGTASDLGVADPFNPDQNIDGGIRYIKQLHDRFGGDTRKAMAAYNWGMGNVEKLGMANMPPETRGYLAKLGLNNGTQVASAGDLPPGLLEGSNPPQTPPAPTPSPVAPTQGVNSPGVSQVPAGITDPMGERLLYGGTGVPHAKDTFTGMQMDQANEIQKAYIQHPGGGAGGSDKWGNSIEGKAWGARQAATGRTDAEIADDILANKEPLQMVEVDDPATGGKKKVWLNRSQIEGLGHTDTASLPGIATETHAKPIPTEASNVRGFAAKMKAAMEGLASVGVPSSDDLFTQNIKDMAGSTGWLADKVGEHQSANGKIWFDNADLFASALLRKESGAAVTADEMKKVVRDFIDLPSDQPEVRANKARSRQVALEALSSEPNLTYDQIVERAKGSNTAPGGLPDAAPSGGDVQAKAAQIRNKVLNGSLEREEAKRQLRALGMED